MTNKQIELARHALGLPNEKNTSYRNYFNCDRNDPDWTAMVAQGDAVMREAKALGGESVYFHLTHTGALKALQGNEKIDEEDVPTMVRIEAKAKAETSAKPA